MAPPTSQPRLRDLTPEALEAEVFAAIERHLGFTLGAALAPRAAQLTGHPGDSLGIGLTVRDLLEHAQTGAALDGPLDDYLLSLSSIYTPVVGDTAPDLEELWDGDARQVPDSLHGRLCLIVRACKAREALRQGGPPHTGWLSALASCSHQVVTRDVADGLLTRVGEGHVEPRGALRWLEARGVTIGRRKPATS